MLIHVSGFLCFYRVFWYCLLFFVSSRPLCLWVHMVAYLMRISMMLWPFTSESIALWSNRQLVFGFSQSWHFILKIWGRWLYKIVGTSEKPSEMWWRIRRGFVCFCTLHALPHEVSKVWTNWFALTVTAIRIHYCRPKLFKWASKVEFFVALMYCWLGSPSDT